MREAIAVHHSPVFNAPMRQSHSALSLVLALMRAAPLARRKVVDIDHDSRKRRLFSVTCRHLLQAVIYDCNSNAVANVSQRKNPHRFGWRFLG
jgi:predicted polyphosphate/ATP-dependent NAD kinase